jgi:uncharacterized membrane protein YccF (DUF307 family)
MAGLFNIIWFIFGGWWSALGWLLLSGIFAITIKGDNITYYKVLKV